MTFRLLVATALAGALLTGCGISLDAQPAAIPPDVLPSPVATPSGAPTATASSATSPTATASASEPPIDDDVASLRLWFVQEDGLTAVESSLPVGSSPEYVMQALVVGPTAVEVAQGLRTIASDPLTGQPLAVIVSTASTDASGVAPITVQLSPDFTALPPTEQVLLLGQVVLSLTGAGESSVAFVDVSGAPLAVPLPDGRLLDGPARARDYGPLIYRP